MLKSFKASAIAAATACLTVGAAPAMAAPMFDLSGFGATSTQVTGAEEALQYDRRDSRNYRPHRYGQRAYYGEPVYRDTRVWRGNDGRVRCRKKDGTTGLIIGGAVGALLGREIDTRGDRSLGTILGAAGGAFLGKEVAGGTTCR